MKSVLWSFSLKRIPVLVLVLNCLCSFLLTTLADAASVPIPRKPKSVIKSQRFYDSVNANILSAAMLSAAGAFNKDSSHPPLRHFRPQTMSEYRSRFSGSGLSPLLLFVVGLFESSVERFDHYEMMVMSAAWSRFISSSNDRDDFLGILITDDANSYSLSRSVCIICSQ